MPPVPWAGWRAVLDVLVIFIGAQIVAGAVTAAVTGGGAAERLVLPVLLVMSPLGSLVVAFVWLRLRYPGRLRALLGTRPAVPSDLWIGAAVGIACLLGQRVIVFVIAVVADRLGLELPAVQETFRTIAQQPETVPVLVVSTVLLAPVAEEVVFRGLLFQGLRARTGFWVAALASALMFTLAHLGEGGGLLAGGVIVSGILPLGVVFAALLDRRGSLVAAIAAHATYNAIGVAALVLIPSQV